MEARGPSMIVFSSSSTHSASPQFHSWEHGPQKLTGVVKRGRPRKEIKVHETKPDEGSRFTFIDFAEGDKGKKAVRRHAMLDVRRRERERERKPTPRSSSETPNQELGPVYKFLKEIVAVEPFDVFPVKIEPYMLYNLSSYATSIYEMLYSIEKYSAYNPVIETWLPMALEDPALLHAIMFCADTHNGIGTGVKESTTAVMHLHKAIRIVNDRLAAPTPKITDPTLIVVATLAHSEKLNHRHENWRIHMCGLRQMVRMRGGMNSFNKTRLVRSKIHRADLCGSVDAFSKPFFTFPHPRPQLSSPLPSSKPTPLAPTFLPHYTTAHHLTAQLNLVHAGHAEIDTLSLREDITALQYTLLHQHHDQSSRIRDESEEEGEQDPMDELCSVALLMYLVTLLDETPPEKSVCNMLGSRLESLIASQGNRLTDTCLLWIIFIASSLVGDAELQTRLLVRAKELTTKLELHAWAITKEVFQSFLWSETIHSISFRRVWDNIEK